MHPFTVALGEAGTEGAMIRVHPAANTRRWSGPGQQHDAPSGN